MTTPRQLGFGAASLGSRISPREGLAALERAYDAGVRWYDVAPSYGDGQAEELLGTFLKDKRGDVSICTKVGILPPRPSLAKRIVRPVLRSVIAAAPQLRSAVKRHRPPAVKPPLTAERVTESIDISLQRLRTDRVDVLALHDATPEEVVRDDILRALETILASGKAGVISIASFAPSIRAGLAASPLYGAVQIANNPYNPGLDDIRDALPADRPIKRITHSVFGASGMVEAVAEAVREAPDIAAAFSAAGYAGTPRSMGIDYLLDFALAGNPDGTVLLSMFSKDHLERNLKRLPHDRDDHALSRIAALLRERAEKAAL